MTILWGLPGKVIGQSDVGVYFLRKEDLGNSVLQRNFSNIFFKLISE